MPDAQMVERRFRAPWPDEIVRDARTRALVDGKWNALAKQLGIE